MIIEYRKVDNTFDSIEITDPSSVNISQQDFDILADLNDELIVGYLNNIDREVLTLILINSPTLIDKITLAAQQAKEDIE